MCVVSVIFMTSTSGVELVDNIAFMQRRPEEQTCESAKAFPITPGHAVQPELADSAHDQSSSTSLADGETESTPAAMKPMHDDSPSQPKLSRIGTRPGLKAASSADKQLEERLRETLTLHKQQVQLGHRPLPLFRRRLLPRTCPKLTCHVQHARLSATIRLSTCNNLLRYYAICAICRMPQCWPCVRKISRSVHNLMQSGLK